MMHARLHGISIVDSLCRILCFREAFRARCNYDIAMPLTIVVHYEFTIKLYRVSLELAAMSFSIRFFGYAFAILL